MKANECDLGYFERTTDLILNISRTIQIKNAPDQKPKPAKSLLKY